MVFPLAQPGNAFEPIRCAIPHTRCGQVPAGEPGPWCSDGEASILAREIGGAFLSTRQRPYVYYDIAISVCATCFRKLEGKIIFQDEKVYLVKRCPEHGTQKVLLSDDVAWYRRCREDFRASSRDAGQVPHARCAGAAPTTAGSAATTSSTRASRSMEICDACNLYVPDLLRRVLATSDSPYRSVEQVERMLDAVVASEGEPDVVQISGGEPAIHPQLFEILDAARARPIRHLMMNTNGIRIAREDGFAERLADLRAGASRSTCSSTRWSEQAHRPLAGCGSAQPITMRAIERLDALNLSTTLVADSGPRRQRPRDRRPRSTIALEHRCVRGITFQPVQEAGRVEAWSPEERIPLSEVRRKLLEQTDGLRRARPAPGAVSPRTPSPWPTPSSTKARSFPLTREVDDKTLIEGTRATISFEREAASPGGADAQRPALLPAEGRDVGRRSATKTCSAIILLEFMDAHSLDVRSVKRSCVHIVHPEDGRLIPFDTYNLFYRDGLEQERLAPLRAELEHA